MKRLIQVILTLRQIYALLSEALEFYEEYKEEKWMQDWRRTFQDLRKTNDPQAKRVAARRIRAAITRL